MAYDYGDDLNAKIAAAKARVVKLYDELQRAESDLELLEQERTEARKECEQCDDCSMCIPRTSPRVTMHSDGWVEVGESWYR
jgi:predicted  nucleic acid-binding Zn-ribbon protein